MIVGVVGALVEDTADIRSFLHLIVDSGALTTIVTEHSFDGEQKAPEEAKTLYVISAAGASRRVAR